MRGNFSFYIIIFLLIAVPALSMTGPASQDIDGGWDIRLNTESIEQILLHPEKILADPDHFWKTDRAYQFAESWHKGTGIKKTSNDYYNKWLDFLKKQSMIPADERKNDPAFQLVNTLKEKMDVFIKKGIPHIRAFLPENGIRVQTGIYLTTRTKAYAWVTDGNMILDPLSYKYKMDADAIFNSLVHEAFHVGYGKNRYLRRENPLDNGFLYDTLAETLQNEGMAVYIAWRAGSFFPAPEDRDYRLLIDMKEVRKRFNWVNEIFKESEEKKLPEKKLRRKSWNLGVDQRAYYIAGAHMCRCIEEKRGRKALTEAVTSGPLSFIDTYNEIAEPGMKVYRFKDPAAPSQTQRLKLAVLDRDPVLFEQVARQMKESRDSLDKSAKMLIWRIGNGQVIVRSFDWALRVCRFETELFPEWPISWYGLANACMESGDLKSAKLYFKKVLEIDPKIHHAELMLEKINRAEKKKEI